MLRILSFTWLCAAVLVASACVATTSVSPTAPSGPTTSEPHAVDQAAAEAYCTSKDGQLVDRVATWNTNADPTAWLTLAGRVTLCEFETGSGDTATRISVDLTTLYSEQPTLAALAYLSKVPPQQPPQVGQNPAGYQCSTGLGGAAAFGDTAAGGGWVDSSQPVFKVMTLCVFADMSAIDAFGIWYYANGTVRGVDLAPILRYQPKGPLPAVFERPSR